MRFSTLVERMFDPKGYKPEGKKNSWKNIRMKNKSASVKEGESMDEYLAKGKKTNQLQAIAKRIKHVQDLIANAPAEDKVKLKATLAGLQADFKKAQETVAEAIVDAPWDEKTWKEIDHYRDQMKKTQGDLHIKHRQKLGALINRLRGSAVKESVEDADIHLQNAHDALVAAIHKAKRSGKDCSKLEKLKADLSNHLKTFQGKE